MTAGVAITSAYFGARVGMNYKQNHLLFELSKRDSLSAALQQAFGIRKYYAAGQQDMWVALAVEPGKRDGYYVDVGSADGVLHSNSYIFDRMGWRGSVQYLVQRGGDIVYQRRGGIVFLCTGSWYR